MQKFYAVEKATNLLKFTADSLALLKKTIQFAFKNENDYLILGDIDMKFVSRITYVDGKCIYNDKTFWFEKAKEISDDFDNHIVKDFLGKPVSKLRFDTEFNSNSSRISAIDGLAGEVEYNITVGNEFISLFREECVKTDFKGITPLEIGIKLAPVISLVQTGSFREAKQVLQTMETDPFLTEERMAKYIAMMDAADAIDYATEEDFYYTASENV